MSGGGVPSVVSGPAQPAPHNASGGSSAQPWPKDCPRPPKDESPAQLGFTRQPMVSWFSLPQLMGTGLKVAISSMFGSFEDKREIEAMLPMTEPPDYTDQDSLWIDYLADTGDGFNSTYTMARFASRIKQRIQSGQGQLLAPRGRILVLGGDEVYPTASRDNYNNRLVGPFRSALPWVPDEKTAPHLYAVAGNHDWYDGLTGFIRMFCQQRWFGGWLTRQQRSYFACKLPHNYWLWGTDIQLDSDVDQPQIEYFQKIAREKMHQGDKVILCTAEPSWAHQWINDAVGYGNLGYFEKTLIRDNGLQLPLVLSGDLHHYSRYQRADGSMQRITAGGGGAFLHSTANLPQTGTLDEGGSVPVTYQREAAYPAPAQSKAMALGALSFLKGAPSYGAMLGFIYLLIDGFLVKSCEHLGHPLFQVAKQGSGFFGVIASVVWRSLIELPAAAADSFGLLATLGYLLSATYFVSDEKKPSLKLARAGVLGLAHLLMALVLMGVLLRVEASWLEMPMGSRWQSGLFSLGIFGLGSIVGATVMGAYLALCALTGRQLGDAFASQGIEDYKNMLKLHIDGQGGLTVYAVGFDKVGKNWTVNPDAKPGEAWFRNGSGASGSAGAEAGEKAIDAMASLIDKPVRFDGNTLQWAAVPVQAGALPE